MMPPIGLIPTPGKAPLASIWRLLDGAWYWSLPKLDALDLIRRLAGGGSPSPGGVSLPPSLPGGVDLPPSLPGGVSLPPSLPAAVNLPAGLGRPEAMTMEAGGDAPGFSLDRTEVALKPSTTEAVRIANTSSAPMTLFLLGKLPGIEAAFDHARIAPGEKAVLSIHAAAEAKGGTLIVGVTETKAMISLPVTVK
jgi:hypothetical protein